MDFDMPSPSQFPSSSQWARACMRPRSADTSDEMGPGIVRWISSQSTDPILQKLIEETRVEPESRPSSSASNYNSTWTPSTSTSTNSTSRTASLPTFSALLPSTGSCSSSGPTTSASTAKRRLLPRKPMSKKVPPSRAYTASARTKDDTPLDLDKTTELVEMIGTATRKADWNSWLKQNMKEKAEKKVTSGMSRDPTEMKNTVSSSLDSRFASASSSAGRLSKPTSTSSVPRASASASVPSLGRPISKTSSSATIKPPVKLSRDSDTDTDIKMTIESDRDTDFEATTFTDSLTDSLNESFSMHVDDITPPPTTRTLGRMHSVCMVSSTTRSATSHSNSALAFSSKAVAASSSTVTPSSEKISQMTHARPPASTSATQRHPPPLGMRRPLNLPNIGLPSSQSRYAITQSPYATSQAKGQKQATLPPFKPPLLSKSVHTSKQSAHNLESPTSTPELEMDDSDGDDNEGSTAVADSSFDVSFDVDRDALEATMRQYD